ncbi:abc transporter f family member 3-like [Stylonychia lemnae]|uniref:Abc transporter f family member 3-like n=1 Tax=Stylonychia lemnae TaxID=5949 RepID=A0A078BAJ9_STYLE|nr:abc transporter f family member 3-like [Stylonychia lemnae]|eukprot:CDW90593.1 abc transporter f family member 3-like [Stylonychia lemnae]
MEVLNTGGESKGAQSEEMVVKDIEKVLRHLIKTKTLTDEAFVYMSLIVNEDAPKNAAELVSLIGDFMTDGMSYTEEEAFKLSETIMKTLLDQKLLRIENRDTITAEKLSNPVVINEIRQTGHSGVIREEEFSDPFLDSERTGNYNTFEDKPWDKKKKKKAEEDKAQDALDKKIEEFLQHKKRVPIPTVVHDKQDSFKTDIIIPGLMLIAGGKTLLDGATLKIVQGRKYGLVGRNGIGKTTLINAISRREIDKFPQTLHILQVEQEVEADDISVLQHVLNCDVEREKLLKELNELLAQDDSTLSVDDRAILNVQMEKINERLKVIQSEKCESKAIKILSGLGFSQTDLNIPSKNFSGGWRMRIAIAKVVFCEPEILLLDEPTNHLDLNALIWLEDYIRSLSITVIIVSHARDFLNVTVDEIIYFFNLKLDYFKGNFDNFEKVKNEKMKLQLKQRESQQEKIEHIQKFIDKFRYNAKRASLVQSRIKSINRMDIIEEVIYDPTCVFIFPNPEKLSPPMLRLDEANIGYSQGKNILEKVNLNIDLETRISLVGPNGAGKSTLLKALQGELQVFEGHCFIHNRLRVGVFTQHHLDSLDLRLSAVEQMMQIYTNVHSEKFRSHLGSFGISGNLALRPMYLLSGGQKSRVAFAMITWTKPHILLLDEPTNHLDFDAINALIVALNNFEGGIIVVSHDQYFLSSVCDRLYVVNKKKVKLFEGDITDYRKSLLK